ncbi:hypothetical protein M1D80_14055 [Phyllobacteriaceae bacterium JZ32]
MKNATVWAPLVLPICYHAHFKNHARRIAYDADYAMKSIWWRLTRRTE